MQPQSYFKVTYPNQYQSLCVSLLPARSSQHYSNLNPFPSIPKYSFDFFAGNSAYNNNNMIINNTTSNIKTTSQVDSKQIKEENEKENKNNMKLTPEKRKRESNLEKEDETTKEIEKVEQVENHKTKEDFLSSEKQKKPSKKRIKIDNSKKEMIFTIIDWDECVNEKNEIGNNKPEETIKTNEKIEIPRWSELPPDSSDEDTSDETFTVRHFNPEAKERKEANRAQGFRLRKKRENDLLHLQKFLTKSNKLKNCFSEGSEVNPLVVDSVITEYIESINCRICKEGDREEELLLCDNCNKAIHTFCHQPPLKEIPTGCFYCKNCKTIKRPKKKKRKATKRISTKKSLHYNLRTKVK